MIQEHDCVVLTQDLADEGLRAGDVGTVVHIHSHEAAYEVEFMTLTGRTVAVATVLPSQLPLYMQDLATQEGHNLSITLQLLERRQYGREVQIRDFAQRVVYALAADAKRIDVPLTLR